jgi:hypothetical protein
MNKQSQSPNVTSPTGEAIPLGAIFQTIIAQINDNEKISTSKGKFVVSHFLNEMMGQEDPFLKSLATLGGQTTINALGVLLFVMFQAGYTFGSEKYTLNPEDFKYLEEDDDEDLEDPTL